ncbi:MAG TPA: hypothetical protein VH951_03460 [Dehalococcoidia bacterium]
MRAARIVLPTYFGAEPMGDPGEALPWSEVEGWLSGTTEWWIVTVGRRWRPHSVPVDVLWVDGTAVFGAPLWTRRGRNVQSNHEVVLHLPGTESVAILEGSAEPLMPGPFLERVLETSKARYGNSAWPAERLVGTTWCLRPRLVLAWRVGDMRNTATRWTFEDRV